MFFFSVQLHFVEWIKGMYVMSTEIVYARLALELMYMAIVFHVVWKKVSKLMKLVAVYALSSVDLSSMNVENVFVQQNTVTFEQHWENVLLNQEHLVALAMMSALIINSATLKQGSVRMLACIKYAA